MSAPTGADDNCPAGTKGICPKLSGVVRISKSLILGHFAVSDLSGILSGLSDTRTKRLVQ